MQLAHPRDETVQLPMDLAAVTDLCEGAKEFELSVKALSRAPVGRADFGPNQRQSFLQVLFGCCVTDANALMPVLPLFPEPWEEVLSSTTTIPFSLSRSYSSCALTGSPSHHNQKKNALRFVHDKAARRQLPATNQVRVANCS